jgi:hypothetical protein
MNKLSSYELWPQRLNISKKQQRNYSKLKNTFCETSKKQILNRRKENKNKHKILEGNVIMHVEDVT